MRTSSALAVLTASLVVVISGCTGPSGGQDIAARTSNERPPAPESDSFGGLGDDLGGDLGDLGNQIDDFLSEFEENLDFNLDEIPFDLPNLEATGSDECIDLALDYGNFMVEAIMDQHSPEHIQDTADSLKDSMPADLHDSVDVIADAVNTTVQGGILEGIDAATTQEFTDANSAITKYLAESCEAQAPAFD